MFTTNIHADEFRARKYQGGFATVDMHDGTTSKAAVFLETPEKCDALIAAATAAKSMLRDATFEPDDSLRCDAPREGFNCTQRRGHAGDHVAHGGLPLRVLDSWAQDATPAGTDAE